MQVLVNQQNKVIKLPVWAGNSNQTKAKTTCPKCGSTDCDRIPRGTLIKVLMPWASLKHYHCVRCLRKFYKFK